MFLQKSVKCSGLRQRSQTTDRNPKKTVKWTSWSYLEQSMRIRRSENTSQMIFMQHVGARMNSLIVRFWSWRGSVPRLQLTILFLEQCLLDFLNSDTHQANVAQCTVLWSSCQFGRCKTTKSELLTKCCFPFGERLTIFLLARVEVVCWCHHIRLVIVMRIQYLENPVICRICIRQGASRHQWFQPGNRN